MTAQRRIRRPVDALSIDILVALAPFAHEGFDHVGVVLEVGVHDDNGGAGRMVEAGRIENVYRLQVMNATESPQRYRITAQGLPGLQMMGEDTLAVDAAQSRWMAIRLQLPPGAATPGSHRIRFAIQALESDASVSEKSIFLIPR